MSRKTCVSPPKFHYAKNSDEPLSGRFSQQRLRESSRVSSPWRRGYFSGLTQVFPHHRVLTGGIWSSLTSGSWLSGYLYFWDKIQEKHIYFQSGTLLSSFSVIYFCALLPIFSLKLYILHFLCYGSSTMYTYMIHDYRIQQFLQTDCHTGFLIVRKWRIPILKTVCFQEETRWILSADFCRNFIPVSFGLHFL